MRTMTLILCAGLGIGLTAAVRLAQAPTSAPTSTTESVPLPAVPLPSIPPPYVVRLAALDEAAATSLRAALANLPGVAEVETFVGDQRAAHVRTRPGHYVSHTQVEAVVRRQGLQLEDFEIPQWARLRVYVVEASGGA